MDLVLKIRTTTCDGCGDSIVVPYAQLVVNARELHFDSDTCLLKWVKRHAGEDSGSDMPDGGAA
jgi:hypothetical protein